jgi:hypothetical protein
MKERGRIATGKHRANRLRLSIAACLLCATVYIQGQTPGQATFLVIENGTPVGSAAITVTREEDGWRVQSTGHTAGTIGVDIRRLDLSYDRAWTMRWMSIEIVRGQETRVIHVAVQGLQTRTDTVIPDKQARMGVNRISPGSIALPDYAFGAYPALAAKVATLLPGTEIPLLLTPRGEVYASVDAVRDEDVRTTSGVARARHVSLLVTRDILTPIELWIANGALLKIELPLDHLSVIRSDVTD